MGADTDFMSELDAAAHMKPSLASNIMLGSIAAFVFLFVVWASFSPVDELVHGAGQVVPSQETQIVQSLEGGVLAELPVREGDRVEKGQVLMRISDVNFASEKRGTQAQLWGLGAKKARLGAEANGTQPEFPDEVAEKAPDILANEQALYKSRQQELANAVSILDEKIAKAKAEIAETEADIARHRDSVALYNQELAITAEMVKQQAVPKLEEIRLRRELSNAQGQLKSNEEKLPGLRAQLASAEKERGDQQDKFRSQALGELNDVETQLAQVRESLMSIGDRVYRAELRSPVDGIVNNIALKTIGGVVEPAQKLMEIVPVGDELKITARVLPNDIAFLKPGQDVRVVITAYDSSRYGSLKGKLVRIGANSVTDREGNAFFEIEVRTDRNYLGDESSRLPISPGMVADTAIIVGKRTIMEYLLKPVVRAKDRALTER